MPLVYRDVRVPRSTTHRLPTWLLHQPNLMRVESDVGDFIGVWDAEMFHPDHIPADAVWHEVGDGFVVHLVGELIPQTLLRATHNLPKIMPLQDSRARLWYVPAIMKPDADPAAPADNPEILLSLPWGVTEAGAVARVPSPEQLKLIETAMAVRREVRANALAQVPLAVSAAWLGVLLQAVYHLDLVVLLKLGVVDDQLCVRALLAAAGYYGSKGT